MMRPIVDPGKASHRNAASARLLQGSYAGSRRRAAGEHIIDQHHIHTDNRFAPERVDDDCARQRPIAGLTPQPAETRCPLAAQQAIDKHLALPKSRELACQQGGLIEPTLPKPPAVQRHWH